MHPKTLKHATWTSLTAWSTSKHVSCSRLQPPKVSRERSPMKWIHSTWLLSMRADSFMKPHGLTAVSDGWWTKSENCFHRSGVKIIFSLLEYFTRTFPLWPQCEKRNVLRQAYGGETALWGIYLCSRKAVWSSSNHIQVLDCWILVFGVNSKKSSQQFTKRLDA